MQYDLEDDDENEEQKHVDNVKDDGLLDSNAEEESGTDEQPVLDQQVPQPTTYTQTEAQTNTHIHTASTCLLYTSPSPRDS